MLSLDIAFCRDVTHFEVKGRSEINVRAEVKCDRIFGRWR